MKSNDGPAVEFDNVSTEVGRVGWNISWIVLCFKCSSLIVVIVGDDDDDGELRFVVVCKRPRFVVGRL